MSLRWYAFLCGFGSDVLFTINHLRSISFFCQNAHHNWLTKEYISNWFLVLDETPLKTNVLKVHAEILYRGRTFFPSFMNFCNIWNDNPWSSYLSLPLSLKMYDSWEIKQLGKSVRGDTLISVQSSIVGCQPDVKYKIQRNSLTQSRNRLKFWE